VLSWKQNRISLTSSTLIEIHHAVELARVTHWIWLDSGEGSAGGFRFSAHVLQILVRGGGETVCRGAAGALHFSVLAAIGDDTGLLSVEVLVLFVIWNSLERDIISRGKEAYYYYLYRRMTL
jgi:hypothetical protein